jgi:hypothetical protein
VLVDGAPRVACVTPARRVEGRRITTVDGLPTDEATRWAGAFCATGASQCGFCTPGIVLRLSALAARGAPPDDEAAVARALQAHLCRCTGWRTILDAWQVATEPPGPGPAATAQRDLDGAAERAFIEGRVAQRVAADVALGRGGFADDTAPADALVAVPAADGGWAVAETLTAARAAAGKVQGRRSTVEVVPPLDLPTGDYVLSLRTSWVEPAYLELDASWCAPGGEPVSPLANGGAFGGKVESPVGPIARRLADEHGRPVRVLLAREDAVRTGPKRPPIAAGVRADGTGVLRVVRTARIGAAIASVAPGLTVEEVDVNGPPTSADLRAAGWAEAAVLLAALHGDPQVHVRSPDGADAWAEVDDRGIAVRVRCGRPLDEVVLRSYCVGAAHMGHGWVRHEGLAVDREGTVHDLTIRSFGILRAIDTPPIAVTVVDDDAPPVNGSDAVFAAVAAATWIAQGCPADWPTERRRT